MYHREVALLTWFHFFVWERMLPRRKSDPQAKPSSVHGVYLAVRREHKHVRLQHCLVPTSAVTDVLKGMTSVFIQKHGYEALLPHRKEPIPYAAVDLVLEKITDGVAVGSRTVSHSEFFWTSIMALVATLKVTAHRKAQVCNGLGEILTRASILWFIADHTEIITPSAADLELLFTTELPVLMGVAAPPSKTDYTGTQYGNNMAYVALTHSITNAAFHILMMERRFPIQEHSRRRTTPLFGSHEYIRKRRLLAP